MLHRTRAFVKRSASRCTQAASRPGNRSSQAPGDIYPADDVLKIPSGELTPSLIQRAARLTTFMSFETVAAELEAQHAIRITDSTLDLLAHRVGGVADANRGRKIDKFDAASPGIAREQQTKAEEIVPAPRVLCISADGIFYPT